MKKFIALLVVAFCVYSCAKDVSVNVLGNAIVNQQTAMEKAGA